MCAEEQPDAPMTTLTAPITIRLATDDDTVRLTRLAVLDSAEDAPPGRVLVAEVDGELRAALSLADGSAIADPFHPTLAILELLRTHAQATEGRAAGTRRRLWLGYALG
jgi:hypothetical protein